MSSKQNALTEGSVGEQLVRYRLLAEISTDWTWETDTDYRIIYMSESVKRTTGFSRETYIGKSRYELASEATKLTPEWARHVKQVDRREPIKNFEYKHVGTDGRTVYLRVNAIPLFHTGGAFRGYLGTTTDISEIVAAMSQASDAISSLESRSAELTTEIAKHQNTVVALQKAKMVAEKASRAKSEFLAHMSHELRTPLTAITGFSQMMADEVYGKHSDVKYLEYSQDVRNSGHHLLAVINDILDLSKIEHGEIVFCEEMFEIQEVIQECANMLRRRKSDQTNQINTGPTSQVSRLNGDRRLFKQIILNLLSNAIKFTPDDKQVTVSTVLDSGNRVVVKVMDTGKGIAPEDLSTVLEPFGQVRIDASISHEGTGLGLPLSQKLMELHGGTLEMQSELGVGTTVILTFPAERTATAK